MHKITELIIIPKYDTAQITPVKTAANRLRRILGTVNLIDNDFTEHFPVIFFDGLLSYNAIKKCSDLMYDYGYALITVTVNASDVSINGNLLKS